MIITGAEPSIIQILAVHQHQNIGTSAGKGFDWDVTAFLQFSPSHCRKVAQNQMGYSLLCFPIHHVVKKLTFSLIGERMIFELFIIVVFTMW